MLAEVRHLFALISISARTRFEGVSTDWQSRRLAMRQRQFHDSEALPGIRVDREPRHSQLEVFNSSVGDFRAVHPQPLEPRQSLETRQAGVRDCGTVKVEEEQIAHSFQLRQPGVCDPRVTELEDGQVSDTLQMRQPGVGDLGLL